MKNKFFANHYHSLSRKGNLDISVSFFYYYHKIRTVNIFSHEKYDFQHITYCLIYVILLQSYFVWCTIHHKITTQSQSDKIKKQEYNKREK